MEKKNSFPWVKKTTMSFFGCPNVYFYGFDKYYYIVPQMKHKKKKKKILNLLKHYELILQL
jgi:hypothetical protein